MLSAVRNIMSPQMTKKPIVAVIGTTGVGKSQLAVSLAQFLANRPKAETTTVDNHCISLDNGVVLSADSMQLYKGLDTITNKVTKEEMGGVEHWGLDIVAPGQESSWDVGRWCVEASKKIESLDASSLPIICGGTHYFIQHFLFPPSELTLTRPTSPTSESSSAPFDPLEVRWKPPRPRPDVPADIDPALEVLLETFWKAQPVWPDNDLPSDISQGQAGPSRSSRSTTSEDHHLLSLYRLLAAVDPNEAGRWHWRDGRKVRRGLERWWERGGGELGQSQVDDEAQAVEGKGRRARFRTLIFWVYEPLETLRPRLDKRVDRMVENGLLREIAEMREIALKMYRSPNTIDHSEGIFQSIGYKEFADLALPQPDPASDPRYPSMLSLTKSRTHQYAKSQLKWIRKQLLPTVREARSLGGEVEVFVVPGGEAGEGPAREILASFIRRDTLPPWAAAGHQDASALLFDVYNVEGIAKVPDSADRQLLNLRRNCEWCSEPGRPYSIAEAEWDLHLSSKTHRRNVRQSQGHPSPIEEQMARRDAIRAEREAARQAKTVATNSGNSQT